MNPEIEFSKELRSPDGGGLLGGCEETFGGGGAAAGGGGGTGEIAGLPVKKSEISDCDSTRSQAEPTGKIRIQWMKF